MEVYIVYKKMPLNVLEAKFDIAKNEISINDNVIEGSLIDMFLFKQDAENIVNSRIRLAILECKNDIHAKLNEIDILVNLILT